MAALLALLGPLALALTIFAIRKYRTRNKAVKDPHRTLKFYDKQQRQYEEITRERDLARKQLALVECESITLRSQVSVLERTILDRDSEVAHLSRDLAGRWEQIEELGRDLAQYRQADTLPFLSDLDDAPNVW